MSLLPRPAERTDSPGGSFRLDCSSTLWFDPGLDDAGLLLAEYLNRSAGWILPVAAQASDADVRFLLSQEQATDAGSSEAYELHITDTGVEVVCTAAAGAVNAVQTLRQIAGADLFRTSGRLPSVSLPWQRIIDRPAHGYRGVMLDVARHFMPKASLLRFIESVAAHKFNVLHLHLSDDQGWRVQIRKYPRLTETGAWRERSCVGDWRAGRYDETPHGGFFTQADIREIVEFARRRNIVIVPEIDVPGHSQAAIAAYPELAGLQHPVPVWDRWGINQTILEPGDATLDFYRNVLTEILELFPGPWIGIGGDEVPPVQWQSSDTAERVVAEHGLDDVAAIHGWFIGQLAAFIEAHGRKAAVWDEVGDASIPRGSLVHSWRGAAWAERALDAGHDVVWCQEKKLYFDYAQSDDPNEPIPVGSVSTLRDVFDSLADADGYAIAGAQGQIWSEHLDSPRRVDYAAFPRLCALSEALWSGPRGHDWEDFLRRLEEQHLSRLDALGVEYRPLAGPHPWQQRPGIPGRLHTADFIPGEQEPTDEAAGK